MGAAASIQESLNQADLKEALNDLYTPALFKKLRGPDGKVSKGTVLDFVQNSFDCFLTHDWGLDECERNNHERVSKFNNALRARGLRTWFDEEEMKGRVRQMMSDGIDSCRCVIVFVTERYIDKVAGKGKDGDKDNCLYEFSYSARTKGPSKMIAVVQENCCADTTEWHGQVGGDLGGSLYVPNWDDSKIDAAIDDLYKKILSIVGKPLNELIPINPNPLPQSSAQSSPSKLLSQHSPPMSNVAKGVDTTGNGSLDCAGNVTNNDDGRSTAQSSIPSKPEPVTQSPPSIQVISNRDTLTQSTIQDSCMPFRYKCIFGELIIREGVELSTPEVKTVPIGEIIEVFPGVKMNSTGRARVRLLDGSGWATLKTGDGDILLEIVGEVLSPLRYKGVFGDITIREGIELSTPEVKVMAIGEIIEVFPGVKMNSTGRARVRLLDGSGWATLKTSDGEMLLELVGVV